MPVSRCLYRRAAKWTRRALGHGAARCCLLVAAATAAAQAPQAMPAPTPAAIQAYESGLDAKARGDAHAAALFFEQALLLAPEFAGAWFDYGLALCDLGDPAGCRNVLEQAVDRYGLPPALRQTIWRTMHAQQGEVRVGLGASTNLLRATSADTITLLLNELPVPAVLDDRYRARGGGFVEGALRWRARWPLQNLTARVDLLGRRPLDAALPGLRSGYAELGIGLQPRTRAGVLVLGLDEGYLGALYSAGIWAEHQFGPEGASLRATIERRKPRDQASWTTTRLMARVPLAADTVFSAGWEYDLAQRERAGRSQQRAIFDLSSGFTLPEVSGYIPRLTLGANLLHARDSDIYSPLFGDVHSRRTRWQVSADLGVNLNRNWRVNFGVLAARQRASIDLFAYKELTGMLSVSYLFD